MTALLTAALDYAAAGWPVFPCRPGTKVPATAHGFKDASTDYARIRAWWNRMPDANVAIACGAPGPDVLDVDCKHGDPGYASLNRIARAGLVAGAGALVRTPSGGIHLWFKGTTGQSNGARVAGLDFRTGGGYAVAPPSRIDGTPYVLEDSRNATGTVDFAAIRRYLTPPAPVRQARPGRHSDTAALARWVAGQGEGNRNAALFWAACRAVESGSDNLDDLVVAGVGCGLPEPEARRTVESARRKVGGAV